jgi:hypothetical protein
MRHRQENQEQENEREVSKRHSARVDGCLLRNPNIPGKGIFHSSHRVCDLALPSGSSWSGQTGCSERHAVVRLRHHSGSLLGRTEGPRSFKASRPPIEGVWPDGNVVVSGVISSWC